MAAKANATALKREQETAFTADAFLARLESEATAEQRRSYERFFPVANRRAGDTFIGVRMGTVFALAKQFVTMPPDQIEALLESDIHEARAGAASIMAKQFAHKNMNEADRQALYELYLRRHDRINDWDLVDLAAYHVVGAWLADRPRDALYRLAGSDNPWERRTAIVATFAFIRRGELDDTFAIAERLLSEEVELVQKAVGWALRSTGQDAPRLRAFLDRHAARMPRAMLRNAIEKLPAAERKRYLTLGRRVTTP